MSIHLKEGTYPLAKKGVPGNLELVRIGDKRLAIKSFHDLSRRFQKNHNLQKRDLLRSAELVQRLFNLGNIESQSLKHHFPTDWKRL